VQYEKQLMVAPYIFDISQPIPAFTKDNLGVLCQVVAQF
jgi:hypothetical protein